VENEARSALGILALESWFKLHPSLEKELRKKIELLHTDQLDDFKNYRKIWKNFLKLIKLDLYNASSFACHDLINQLEHENNLKN
jgi:hypothetical protein